MGGNACSCVSDLYVRSRFGASQTKMVYSDLVNSIKSEQVSSMLVSEIP